MTQEKPSDYQQVLKIFDKKGDYTVNVLKFNLLRNDLQVTLEGWQRQLHRAFAAGSQWRRGSKEWM